MLVSLFGLKRRLLMIVLEYEDFTHTGLGLETYTDGVQHPLELRKILIGDLSQV